MRIVADEHIPLLADLFSDEVELILLPPEKINRVALLQADALIVRTRTKVTSQLLAGTRVRAIASATSGLDHIDIATLDSRGIVCFDAKGSNSPAVHDYVWGTIRCLQQQQILSPTMRCAVIGVGHTGRLIAARLLAVGHTVLLCDPFRAKDETDFQHSSLAAIEQCDMVTLHTPLTQAGPYPTYHMITKQWVETQKSGCVVINTARGEIIEPPAVWTQAERVKFIFDVYPNEPEIDRRYLDKGFITTPHIAGYAIESKLRASIMVVEQLCQHLHLSTHCLDAYTMPKEKTVGFYHPDEDHAALQAIKTYSPKEFSTAFNALREKRALRHEFSND